MRIRRFREAFELTLPRPLLLIAVVYMFLASGARASAGVYPPLPDDFPRLSEPGFVDLVGRFKQDYARVTKDPAYFSPTSKLSWPADLNEEQLYTMFGLQMMLPEQSRKMDKRLRKHLREMGIDPDTHQVRYSAPRLIPLSIQIVDGRIVGDAEVLSSYRTDLINSGETSRGQTVHSSSSHVTSGSVTRARFKVQGETAQPLFSVTRAETHNAHSTSDPKLAKTMSKLQQANNRLPPNLTFTYAEALEGQTVSFLVMSVAAPGFAGAKPTTILTVVLSKEESDGIELVRTYTGSQNAHFSRIRDGKLDGEQITRMKDFTGGKTETLAAMKMEDARFVVMDGVRYIEQRKYFEKGVEIKKVSTQ